MTGRIQRRLWELGITLPNAPSPSANYVPFQRSANQNYISGQFFLTSNESGIGKVEESIPIENGYAAARLCGLNILAQLQVAVGGYMDQAKAIKLGGFVNALPKLMVPPSIINGASALLINVMGQEAGSHSCFALAVASLPSSAAIEVDAIFEIANKDA